MTRTTSTLGEQDTKQNDEANIESGLFAGLHMAGSVPKSLTKSTEEEGIVAASKDMVVRPHVVEPVVTSSPATDKLLQLLGGDSPVSRIYSKQEEKKEPADVTEMQQKDSEVESDMTEQDDTKAPAVLSQFSKRASLGSVTEEAFSASDVPPVASLRNKPKPPSRRGVIHEDTPIPNSDVALRLLRKFLSKTRPKIPVKYGGDKKMGILGYLFGSSSKEDDFSLVPYKELVDIVWIDGTTAHQHHDESDMVVEAVLGQPGDDMERAKQGVASFCHTLSIWCHASRHEGKESTATDLLAIGMDTATSLVAHGCMDSVDLILSDQRNQAVHLLAESIIVTDLTVERSELAALKFLLTTGCRTTPDGGALLRGTHLLQSIRVLYHVYLTTDSETNKTTARASLQQLVTSVIKRMLLTPHSSASAVDGFPSHNHRDAFLVLRSLCKLSLRNLPDRAATHTGLSTSGSATAWDGGTIQEGASSPTKLGISSSDIQDSNNTKIQIMSLHAIHPALESKVLALELLLYVLQNTDMSGNFLQASGPQFQSAVRNYLCVSLLKNCTSDTTRVVNLSLRLFVPLIRNFRSHLKTEIEAFVTNVFFVILDSKHSTVDHKILVVILFEEICSDPQTLAEIFLNYDCDLSAVDLFHRIVNTLSRVAKTPDEIIPSFGASAARMEKMRNEGRQLRLEAMKALRQVLASLHASIVVPYRNGQSDYDTSKIDEGDRLETPVKRKGEEEEKKTLVQIYDSKKKRREEESKAILRFNQKPSAGIKYAADCGHIDASDPADVARYLLKNKDVFDKTQIGEFLGREPSYQDGFSLKVLHEYVNMLDFTGLLFDDAIKYYLSGFRLPGEAQKIDRIMEKFAERYTNQNPNVFPTADVAFILAFSIIMLNTDLHNPAIKEERRMTKEGFIRNNRGICDGQDLPEDMLVSIFDRIKRSPISLKEDDEARAKVGGDNDAGSSIQAALSPAVFFSSHYEDIDKDREHNFQKERDHIVRTTESLLRRKRAGSIAHSASKEMDQSGGKHLRQRSATRIRTVRFVRTEDTGLRDEYVAPMFEVTWAPALAAFATAMESANGTMGALLAIATDEELEHAAENAAETIEVCLTGFRFAVCTAGLCGNETARDAFMLALSRFTLLGAGTILEPRHVRCIQTLLHLGKDDGELLGNTWEHVFKALSEIHRFHELFQLMARNDRAAAAAAERRRKRLEERERRRKAKLEMLKAIEAGESVEEDEGEDLATDDGSITDDELFSDDDEFLFEDEMDKREIDEANARVVYDAVSEALIEAIYQRSASLSGPSIMEFVYQLCRVSRMEISGYGGHAGSEANTVDLSQTHYRQQHTLLTGSTHGTDQPHLNQPNIYNLQKLVEVTHYNMDSRPRLVFSDIWTTVAAHLTSTALHSNAAVAMYAVDSFRQLSTQYLQREELGGFEFQRKFLKPFETVMSKSDHVSVKELLLKCVERIIIMFGDSDDQPESHHLGTLRSGWRPVLAVLGLAGQDKDEHIAQMGFKMLTQQLRHCLSVEKDVNGIDKPRAGVLLAERFVDLVDSLFMYVSGPHEGMSLVAIDHLVTLTTFLADESFALPLVKKRPTHRTTNASQGSSNDEENTDSELELWWPILLGLSRSVGDSRKQVRLKTMVTLLAIINEHFFPKQPESASPQLQLQTLRLIFRGVLTPVLEHADSDVHLGPSPALPDDFERFATKPPLPLTKDKRNLTWLETTFEHFMDGCIALCMRSIETFNDDALVEEIFAMLNSCTLSDSGGLAVRGLRRLHQFVTKDLDSSMVNDNTWATVCHMLRRCLSVRGLPPWEGTSLHANGTGNPPLDEKASEPKASAFEVHEEAIREFVAEEQIMQDRRYIGGNVAMIIGSLLSIEENSDSMGLRWRVFLTSGLGRGVMEWETAGTILADHSIFSSGPSPPNYIENAIYGRKWMNRLILHLIEKVPQSPSAQAVQVLIQEQTQSLITLFLSKEAALSPNGGGVTKAPSWEATQLTRITKLIYDFISSVNALEDSVLSQLSWLTPMLESCMESSNETVRRDVSKLQQRINRIANEQGEMNNPNSNSS